MRFAHYEGSDPNGIRTRVTAVKGRCPRPLDDRVNPESPIFTGRWTRQITNYLNLGPVLSFLFKHGRPGIVQSGVFSAASRFFFAAFATLSVLDAFAAADPAPLDAQSHSAVAQFKAGNLTREQTEKTLLQFISSSRPNEQGPIYAALAQVFENVRADEDKITEYASMALSYDLRLSDKYFVNRLLGMVFAAKNYDHPSAETRRAAADYYLCAFAAATEALGSHVDEERPFVNRYDVVGDRATLDKIEKTDQAEMARRESHIENIEPLQMQRLQMEQLLEIVYNDSAVDVGEFEQLAQKHGLREKDIRRCIEMIESSRRPRNP